MSGPLQAVREEGITKMAQTITRKFEVYQLKAYKPAINDSGELVAQTLYDGEALEVAMNDTKARKIVCEKLGIGRVPQGTMLSYVKTGERVYAMPTHTFIENATMIETTE